MWDIGIIGNRGCNVAPFFLSQKPGFSDSFLTLSVESEKETRFLESTHMGDRFTIPETGFL